MNAVCTLEHCISMKPCRDGSDLVSIRPANRARKVLVIRICNARTPSRVHKLASTVRRIGILLWFDISRAFLSSLVGVGV